VRNASRSPSFGKGIGTCFKNTSVDSQTGPTTCTVVVSCVVGVSLHDRVHGVVERRTHEVVHARIDNHIGGGSAFDVKHLCYENAGITADEAARFKNKFGTKIANISATNAPYSAGRGVHRRLHKARRGHRPGRY